MEPTKAKICCRNVCKIFGPHPKDALGLIKENLTKEEIQKHSGHVVAVRNVSFNVNEGEIFIIMGLSGSGKSTLIRCLNRLVQPTQGQIIIDGVDVTTMKQTQLRAFRRNKISMVFQHFVLFPHLSVEDNVSYGLEVRGERKSVRRERALEVIQMVGLKGWENSYRKELSGGMRQRVGLARALAVNPDILLMDEPFSALDPLIRRELQDEFVDLMSATHKTVVFVTHDLNEAFKLGDRIAIMRDGQFIQVGNPEDLVANPADKYVKDFLRDIPRGKVIPVRNIAVEPKVSLYTWQGPRVAQIAMMEKNTDHAFVVDTKRRLIGVVTLNDVKRAIENSVPKLEAIGTEDISRIMADRPIEEAMSLAATDGKPVAVVDQDGVLLGEIPIMVLLSAMAGTQGGVDKKNEPSSA